MRTLGEVLFWVGQPEVILAAMALTHAVIFWRWRHAPQRWFSVAWLAVMLGLTLTVAREAVIIGAVDRLGYDAARLAGSVSGAWISDDQALVGVLHRWRSTWLPIYLPWCAGWLGGLVALRVVTSWQRVLRGGIS